MTLRLEQIDHKRFFELENTRVENTLVEKAFVVSFV